MKIKTIYINSLEFNDYKSFLKYMTSLLFINPDEKPLDNLDAFDDALDGGFGVYSQSEPIKIKWKNFRKSKEDLGYEETIEYYKKIMHTCHPSNRVEVQSIINSLEDEDGKTLFDLILESFIDSRAISIELF